MGMSGHHDQPFLLNPSIGMGKDNLFGRLNMSQMKDITDQINKAKMDILLQRSSQFKNICA
jgi:hypothetical protein